MKFISALSFFFSSAVILAQQPELIEYAAVTNFNWGMFQGKVNKDHLTKMGQNTGAVTVSSISYSTEQTSAKAASIIITARFNTQESWTRYPELNNSDEALNHEKRHLDITEIYARKLRHAVSKARFSSLHFTSELDRMFNDLAAQHRAEQARYDHETKHSTDSEQQSKWDKKIDDQLKALSDYINIKIAVRLD
jgi:hypothetical protein